jgi:hypothetical protein
MTTITLEPDGHATAVERRAEIEPLGVEPASLRLSKGGLR